MSYTIVCGSMPISWYTVVQMSAGRMGRSFTYAARVPCSCGWPGCWQSQEEILGWVARLPGPCAVTYESGPTGFGLARALISAGVRCEVAASSKLQRPGGDRVKTDARDAMHLAKLLRLDELTPVRVPAAAEEAARDLVRARELYVQVCQMGSRTSCGRADTVADGKR